MSKERPTQEQREAVAQNIRDGGGAATETVMEELGIADGTPILDEAQAEADEGGGPIADAVAELDKESKEEMED
jgi:hypothetical protein